MTVYCVSCEIDHGDDNTLCAIFSTEAKAEAFRDKRERETKDSGRHRSYYVHAEEVDEWDEAEEGA